MSAKDVPRQPGILLPWMVVARNLAKVQAGAIHAARPNDPRGEENDENRDRDGRDDAGNLDRRGRVSAQKEVELRMKWVLLLFQWILVAIRVRGVQSIQWGPVLRPVC